MINRYVIEIFYSDEDGGFIAVVPELPGCSAFGATPTPSSRSRRRRSSGSRRREPRDTRSPNRPAGRSPVPEIDVRVSGLDPPRSPPGTLYVSGVSCICVERL